MLEKCWNLLVVVMDFFIRKLFCIKLTEEQWKAFLQFVQFGIVGLSNTLISYVTYLVLCAFGMNYLVASVIGFCVSVVNSFYWNNKYVFKEEEGESRSVIRAFIKTFLSYAGTGLVLANILLFIWVDGLSIPQWLAPIINLFVTIPLNFILNKLWAFKTKKVDDSKEA